MLVDAYLATMPASRQIAASQMGVDMIRAATGRGAGSVSLHSLAKWRRGAVPIPPDVADHMRQRVVLAWPGQFDRAGLLAAMELPHHNK